MSRLAQLLDDLRDPYWRLDHQFELMIIAAVLTGLVELGYRLLARRLEVS